MNSKGQEFEVFNILIGAILALAILVIIFSLIDFLDNNRITSSVQAIQQKVKNSAQSPDGSVFVAKNVLLSKNFVFNSIVFSKTLNIQEQCVEFDIPDNVSWIEYPNFPQKNIVVFTRKTQTDFYILCQPENINFSSYSDTLNCDSSCEFCCLASFGINPSTANS